VRLRDGRSLTYRETGAPDGAAVVLFHGSPGSRLFVPRSTRADVRLITFDRAGYGGSDPQPERTVLDTARDVGELLDHLGVAQAGIVGWSGGCPFAVATAFALDTRRVGALALVSGPGPLDEVPGAWDALGERRGPTAAVARAGDVARASRAIERHMAPFIGNPVSFLGTGKGPDGAVTRAPEHWPMLQDQIAEALRTGASGIAGDLVAAWLPFGFALAEVPVPAAVFHAGLDRYNGHDMRTFADRIPGSTLTVWPDLGHFAILDRFDEVLDAVTDARAPSTG
jgi:pimeloyl-ACP methyl ester carboxylesterase